MFNRKRFTVQDINRRKLVVRYIGFGRWFLYDLRSQPQFQIEAAKTFDGSVAAAKITAIAPDGDSFNLRVQGQTRHAKYLIVSKARI